MTHQTIWDYSRLDSQLLTRLILNTDFDQILDNDVHTATDQFVSAILLAAEASIPKKKVRANKCKKPWMTAELLKHIRKRDKIFRHAKQTQKTYDWDRWKYERNIVTAMNKRLKQQHIQRQVNKLLEHKRDPYKYHQTLRTITGRARDESIPPLEGPDGELLTDDFDKATLLNEYFANQATIDIQDTNKLPQINTNDVTSVPALAQIVTSEREVLQILNFLMQTNPLAQTKFPLNYWNSQHFLSQSHCQIFSTNLSIQESIPQNLRKLMSDLSSRKKVPLQTTLATVLSACYLHFRRSSKKLFTNEYTLIPE